MTDPNYKNDLSFSSMDDSPTNNGYTQGDWDEIPHVDFKKMREEEEIEDGDYEGEFGERYD